MEKLGRGAVGSWLQKQCKMEGLSLRKASARVGLSHATIDDLIKGGNPSPATILKLAQAFSGGGDHSREALEDMLLTHAGYRSERKRDEINVPMARLLDKLSKFSEPQLRIVGCFCDFLSEEAK